MLTTIDSAGRLVIPVEIRREAALQPGMPLEIRVQDGRIEIEPQPLPVKLERRGHLLVASPVKPVAALGTRTVEETVRSVRRGRRSK